MLLRSLFDENTLSKNHMLKKFEAEIAVLSIKKIKGEDFKDIELSIKAKLPTSEKAASNLLKYSTSRLCEYVRSEDYLPALGLARFIFSSGLKKPMMELRKQGAFRISKTQFNHKFIAVLMNDILHMGYLDEDDERYIRNTNTLLILASGVKETENRISEFFNLTPNFLKTLLAVAEIRFSDLLWDTGEIEKSYLDDFFYKNKESVLSSASHLVKMFRLKNDDEIKYNDKLDVNHFDLYSDLIDSTFSLTSYLKAEIDLDFYDYDVITNEEKNDVFVTNEEFETAKDYGYTKTSLRTDAQVKRYRDQLKLSKSYLEFLQEFWDRAQQDDHNYAYHIEENPLRVTVACEILEYDHIFNIFGGDELFLEEAMQLKLLMDENYNEDAMFVKICGDFTCFDIFKLQRFFIYIGFIYRQAVLQSGNFDKEDIAKVRMRSSVPVMGELELIGVFSKITGKSPVQCKKLLREIASGPVTAEDVIDLQYNPVIKIAEKYVILPNVFGHSNLIRSLAKGEGVHFSVVDKVDHMVKKISEAMQSKGFTIFQDFKFGVDEVDVVAVMGEDLFLFECKNPYHPVNDFELRNTHSHIVKGISQLENMKQRFSDQLVFEQFLKNLSIPVRSVKNVRYGVINANRALSGWGGNGIKVFHANEFINLILTGCINSAELKLNVWHGDKFQVGDLIAYMDGEIVSNDLIKHKIPIVYPMPLTFGNQTLHFRTFRFDLGATGQYQRKKYRTVGSAS